MAKRRKGRVPAQLRPYLFKKSGSSVKRRGRSENVAKRRKRKGRSYAGGSSISVMDPAIGFGYGFARGKITQMAMPLLSKIPGGAYADNIALGGGVFLASYFFKPRGIWKDIARDVVVCESFHAGLKAAAGVPLTGTAVASSATGGIIYG